MTIKATPLSMWESGREFQAIGTSIARNRKLLKDVFERIAGKRTHITFEEGKKALLEVLTKHVNELDD